jgi:polyisoprenoid-binding protein YceI
MSTTDTLTQIAPPGTWQADPVHSHVAFEVEYAGTSTFRGGFTDFDATLEDGRLAGAARIASVTSQDENLTGHLLSPDFFDAERFPEIAFRATAIERDGDRVTAHGEITLKGVTQPVELQGKVSGPAGDPFGRERLGLKLETVVDRTEFGISWNQPLPSGGNYISNDVRLIAELALVRQEA